MLTLMHLSLGCLGVRDLLVVRAGLCLLGEAAAEDLPLTWPAKVLLPCLSRRLWQDLYQLGVGLCVLLDRRKLRPRCIVSCRTTGLLIWCGRQLVQYADL